MTFEASTPSKLRHLLFGLLHSSLAGICLALPGFDASCSAQSPPIFVQGTAFLDSTFSASGVSATFSATPTAGNTIIVGCMGDGGSTTLSPSGVTDNQGNTYTQLVFQNYVGSGQPTALYVAGNIQSSGIFTVSCSGLDRVDALNLFALEYSGLVKDTLSALDSISVNTAQTGSYPRICGTVTTTAANDLIVALFNNDGTDSPAGIIPSADYSVPGCIGGSDGTCASQDGSVNQLGVMFVGLAPTPGNYVPSVAQGPIGRGSQSICVVIALKASVQ